MSRFFSNGYAVVIGVGADLPITIQDANAVASQLKDPTRCAYPENQVHLLTGENAQRDNILSALDWLGKEAGSDDTAIVYFSGHGSEIPEFLLVPFGFDWNNLAATAITGKEFTECLRSIQTKKLLVLLDCCHAGGVAEAKGAKKSPIPSEAIQVLGESSGRVVIASSRKNEVSWTAKPYSQFTIAILEAMAGYGAFEKDGYARVLDMALWVARMVPNRTNDKQNPIIKVNNLKDNFAIAWYAGGDASPKVLPWTISKPAVYSESNDAEVQSWKRMLKNYKENLSLILEREAEYVLSTDIPLLYEKEKRTVMDKISDLEQRLKNTQ